MTRKPEQFTDAQAIADAIIERVGRDIRLGLPLGLGKANHIANALYARAAGDASITLTIYTALTLEKPAAGKDLEQRFMGPVAERLFGDYPDLKYASALKAGNLPGNIRVHEFFLLAGRWLGVAGMQQNFINANYTYIVRLMLDRGVNVIAQLVAADEGKADLSASCNPDLTIDFLQARRQGQADFLFVGQVNNELPFMGGDARIGRGEVDLLLEGEDCQFPLVGPPKMPVGLTDYAAALHIARLVKDDGTLQIGIGSIADAVAQALILRHTENEAYRQLIGRLPAGDPHACETAPFEKGLYACSEMLADTFLDLIDAGIIAREVDGYLVDAAFFLGSRDFYQRLRNMPQDQRTKINMTSVRRTNEICNLTDAIHEARRHARFINKAMMVTLMGAVVSDGLENGQVVSGVGGQFDFASQAFDLAGARSIITLDAVRHTEDGPVSNIRWSYGHETVPRHLRDMVVTEYGVADLRGKPDAEVIAALLNITDSRFQEELLDKAKSAGKIARDYRIPEEHRTNTPGRVESVLRPAREEGLLPAFPFGTEFTETEQRLLPALAHIKRAAASKKRLAELMLKGLGNASPEHGKALKRMCLDSPAGLRDRALRALLLGGLRQAQAGS